MIIITSWFFICSLLPYIQCYGSLHRASNISSVGSGLCLGWSRVDLILKDQLCLFSSVWRLTEEMTQDTGLCFASLGTLSGQKSGYSYLKGIPQKHSKANEQSQEITLEANNRNACSLRGNTYPCPPWP